MDTITFTAEDVERGYKIVTTCCNEIARCVNKLIPNDFGYKCETIDYCYCTGCKRVISIENNTPDLKSLLSPKEPTTLLIQKCELEPNSPINNHLT